jgi:hypothetical protein
MARAGGGIHSGVIMTMPQIHQVLIERQGFPKGASIHGLFCALSSLHRQVQPRAGKVTRESTSQQTVECFRV